MEKLVAIIFLLIVLAFGVYVKEISKHPTCFFANDPITCIQVVELKNK